MLCYFQLLGKSRRFVRRVIVTKYWFRNHDSGVGDVPGSSRT